MKQRARDMKIPLAIIAILMLASTVEAKVLYVDGSAGSDATTYDANGPNNPWQSLGRATWGSTSRNSPNPGQAARAGDTVIVQAGTYHTTQGIDHDETSITYQPANSGTPGNHIIFRANGTVHLTHTLNTVIIGTYGADYIVWDGFTVDENVAPPAGWSVALWDTTGSRLENLRIIADPGFLPEDNHAGIFMSGSNDIVIRNNRISGLDNNQQIANAAGILIYYSGDLTFENNEIWDSGSGIFVKAPWSADQGSRWIDDIRIRNNYIHDVTYGIIVHRNEGTASNPTLIYQNLVRNAGNCYTIWPFPPPGAPYYSRIVNNIADGCRFGGLNIRGGSLPDESNHIFMNNIVINSNYAFNNEGLDSNVQEQDRLQSNGNLFYNFSTFSTSNGINRNFAQWTALGQDSSSQTANPLFINPAALDYRLQAGSPALTMGVDILDLDSDGSTTDTIPSGAFVTGNEVIGPTTANYTQGPDTTPPIRSNGQPSGALPPSTTQATVSLVTNEAATCRYSTSVGIAYASMTQFTSTGGVTHSMTVTGLASGQSYSYHIRCQDGTGNTNTNDFTISFSVSAPDSTAPSQVTGLSATAASSSQIDLNWNAATDNVAVTGYRVSRNGISVANTTSLSYQDSGLLANTSYTYIVAAYDSAGNQGTPSISASATTPAVAQASGTIYLSDLNWTTEGSQGYRDLRNTGSGPIVLGGITYAKGIGTHSPANFTFSIPAGCQYFVSDIGIDDVNGENGQADFKVHLNGVQVYASGPISGNSPTVTINLSLGGASILKLELDPLSSISRDTGDWANARFLCGPVQQSLEGDVNSDRSVNILDIQLIVAHFGKTANYPASVELASPGVIDLFDVMVVVRNWGRTA